MLRIASGNPLSVLRLSDCAADSNAENRRRCERRRDA
jgi:hypothetical protein